GRRAGTASGQRPPKRQGVARDRGQDVFNRIDSARGCPASTRRLACGSSGVEDGCQIQGTTRRNLPVGDKAQADFGGPSKRGAPADLANPPTGPDGCCKTCSTTRRTAGLHFDK